MSKDKGIQLEPGLLKLALHDDPKDNKTYLFGIDITNGWESDRHPVPVRYPLNDSTAMDPIIRAIENEWRYERERLRQAAGDGIPGNREAVTKARQTRRDRLYTHGGRG